MCGIFCLFSHEDNSETVLLNKFEQFREQISRRGPNSLKTEYYKFSEGSALLVSSVLWLQGSNITVQPFKDQNGSVLIYNGDIFGGPSFDVNTRQNDGDTKLFFHTLENANKTKLPQVLEKLQGPFAFVYLNVEERKLYFGRDHYGRRSLLIGKSGNDIILTSVAPRNTDFDFIELPCIGIFSFDFNLKTWYVRLWSKQVHANKFETFQMFLERSITCSLSAFEEIHQFVPPCPKEQRWLNQILKWPAKYVFRRLLSSPGYSKIIKQLKQLLRNSVRLRVLAQPKFCQNCYGQLTCDHATTGVLFSGGVDCAILALLADSYVDKTRPIDLINVAFEKNGSYDTPDRITGLSTLSELQSLRPRRVWNFVQVDIPKEELDRCRTQHIADLIYPLKSILDDSLGCALWFASRAQTPHYKSGCRILLVGMGADELFGGYTRHRAAYQKGGWKAVHDVLYEDWQNLPHRNLGRDDRVVSDHGRQLRTPYLDEEVVKFVQRLDCWRKTFPTNELPQGVGEKFLLRSLAFYLGLKKAATFPKRALQFGSRIANPKEKAHEDSTHLLFLKE